MEDYYKVLGLKRGANLKEISAAYRSQALIYHPDKRKSASSPGEDADEKFHKIKAAYQALQDPKIRAELDLQIIGKEERLKRDAQMSAKRKQLKDQLLSREKEALNPSNKRPLEGEEQTATVPNTKKKLSVKCEDSSLILKCKFPSNLDQKFKVEMIKSLLNENLLVLHEMDTNFVAEFKDPQEAYKTLCKLPNDIIIKADWYTGYPPDNLNLNIPCEHVRAKTGETVVKEVKYSKEFENSILEKLKRKKLEK
jgi:curved DNA-binding protein CbpA